MPRRFSAAHSKKGKGSDNSPEKSRPSQEETNKEEHVEKNPNLKSLMNDWLSSDKQYDTRDTSRTAIEEEEWKSDIAEGYQCPEEFPSLIELSDDGYQKAWIYRKTSEASKKGNLKVGKEHKLGKVSRKDEHKLEDITWTTRRTTDDPVRHGRSWNRQWQPPEGCLGNDFPLLSHSANASKTKDYTLKAQVCEETASCERDVQSSVVRKLFEYNQHDQMTTGSSRFDKADQYSYDKPFNKDRSQNNAMNRQRPFNTRNKPKSPSKRMLLSDHVNWQAIDTNHESDEKTKHQLPSPIKPPRYHTVDTPLSKKDAAKEQKQNVHLPKITSELLDIEKLRELKDKDDNFVLFTLTEECSGFVVILNQEEIEPTDVCLIMTLLARACSNYAQPQSVFKILLDVERSLFCTLTIPSVLTKMVCEICHSTETMLQQFVEDILTFLIELSSRLPHSITHVLGILALIKMSVDSMTQHGMLISDSINSRMKLLEIKKAFMLRKMEKDGLKTHKDTTSDLPPPSDFRKISIMPTYDDIYPTTQPFIRKIKTTGGYSNLGDYLDVQFRLLREDFIQPLREGISEYLIGAENPKLVSVRTYHDVCVLKSKFNRDKFIHTVTFNTHDLKDVDWKHTKRLIYGTLVCLSNDNFNTFSIATVESGPKENPDFDEPTVDLFVEHIVGEREIDIHLPMVMVETSAYFEAYRYVLASLQNIKEAQLPFQDYIVHCNTDVKPPAYLRNTPKVKYDFNPVLDDSYKVVEAKKKRHVKRQRYHYFNLYAGFRRIQADSSDDSSDNSSDDSGASVDVHASDRDTEFTKEEDNTEICIEGSDTSDLFGDADDSSDQSEDNDSMLHGEGLLDSASNDSMLHGEGLLDCASNDCMLHGDCLLDFVSSGDKYTTKPKPSSDDDDENALRHDDSNRTDNTEFQHEDADADLNETEDKTSASDDSETVNARESILNLKNWPRAEDLHLDAIQFQAFQQALTKEFVIMQGPPGTGKTYVGLKIVKALLANSAAWEQGRSRPMLIVCYTNHALDQFLEGILSFYSGTLVRVGSRCNNEKVKPYGIKEMRSNGRFRRNFDGLGTKYVSCQMSLLETQDNLRMLDKGIVSYDSLKVFIKQSHHQQFTETTASEDSALLNWLDLLTFEPTKEKENVKLPSGKSVVKEEEIEMKLQDLDDSIPLRETENNEDKNDSPLEEGEAELAEIERKLDDANDDFEEHFRVLGTNRTTICSPLYNTLSQMFSRKKCRKLLVQISAASRMTKDEEMDVDDIWSLPYEDRWRLYRFWVHQLREDLERNIIEKQQECVEAHEEYRVEKLKTDKTIMKRCSVIGMTTSGAARYQKVLSDIKPRIIIIEEAAEVLEGHVIAALSSKCQHLILIGDHQQLRPSTNVYVLAKRYNLELSLFERMVKNGLQCICLEKQHRMRPSISRIMKHIYPNLRDDESVQDFPDILGVCSNVFFINHSTVEQRSNELISHLNIFEARYVTALCLYLIKQGYTPNSITILTTYSAQVAYLRQNMPTETFEGVKVTSVDNYQGEENDIILLSLVRSNLEGNVGFLKIDNRVCVALSRAKKGLYVIGNFQLLKKQSSLWKNIIDDLKSEGHIGPALGLYCQNHPNDSGIKASKPEDFLLAPEGGCIKACVFRLNCGHVCASPCHHVDPEHLKYQCNKPCEKVIPSCEHKQQVPCWKDPNDFRCMHPVMHKGKCGHEVEVSCSERDVPCKAACNTVLKCGHTCTGLCHQCSQGRLHVPCTKPCNKILICGHECQSICSSCPPCELICENKCVHGICGGRCGDPCTPCNEPCAWTCKDKKCTKRCSEPCNRQRCDKRCPRMLKCRHRCIGLCGEICPMLCRKCNEDDVRTYLPEKGNFTDALFVQLEDCGHIVEVSALDTWVKDSSESKRIHLTQCPWCLTCIRKNLRYGDTIKQTMVDLDTVKIQIKEEESIWATKTDNESKEQKQSFSGSHEIKTLYKNAVQTLQGRIAVQNQTRILKCIHGILKCLYEVTSSTISYYQYNRQFQREQHQFQKWLLEPREVFTEQEASDAENELKRLRLFIDVQYFEIKMKVSRKPLSEEQQSNFEVVKQYLLDGNRYTLERQQKFDETLSDLAVFLGISEERAQVMSSIQKQEAACVIHMPMKFTADHWFKCNEGHIYYVSAGGDTAVCPRCASKLGGTNSTQQEDNLLATTSDDSSELNEKEKNLPHETEQDSAPT